MESLPQIGLATVTLVCGLGCGLLILIGGIAFVVLRFGVLDRLMGGVGGAVDAAGDLGDGLGISGLMGDDQPDEQVRGQRQRAYRRAEDIRARYDQQFSSQVGGEPLSTPSYDEPLGADSDSFDEDSSDKARYKRRYRRDNPDYDDEMDSFFDDSQL
jgi:hypothetical protein